MIKTQESNIHAKEISYEFPEAFTHRDLESSDFIFTAYGCALIESKKEIYGRFVYTAINLKTGKSKVISRHSLRVGHNAHVDMATKISLSPIRGDGRFISEKKAGEKLDIDSLTDTANRIFKDILPKYGYAVRERQIELTNHILGVINRRCISLAESEVGTGKTHAYLIAAVLAKRGRINDFRVQEQYKSKSWIKTVQMPMVISTSSIALQKAIVADYIPELSEILIKHGVIRTPLTAAIRKGKEHYICELRLNRYYQSGGRRIRMLLAPYFGEDASYDLSDADMLSHYIKRAICVTGKCDENCPYRVKCRYHQYIYYANSNNIDFQITNHNYFLADKRHRVEGKRPLLPDYQLVIIDEAHKFLHAARSMYGVELIDSEISFLARDIKLFVPENSNYGKTSRKYAHILAEQGRKLFEQLNDNILETYIDDEAERFPAIIDADILRHIDNITGLSADIAITIADCCFHAIYKERQNKAIRQLSDLNERVEKLRKHGKLIFWLENRVDGESVHQALCAIPKDLDLRLYKDMWKSSVPIILTSGTLSASKDFTRMKETLGLNHLSPQMITTASLQSPFDYKNKTLLYISKSTPFPDNKDKGYIAAVADEIERLVFASHGHAAVLFTSYNAMGQVHAILTKRELPFPLFRLERGGTHAIEQFKKSGIGILLASGALWEGIDIPGDALSMLIIVKLPFSVPDPISDYERSQYSSMETYKRRVIIPDMIVKLKQGFGRLIRTERDSGVCAILDSRVREGAAYHKDVVRALPQCRVTSNIIDVSDFIASSKGIDYFLTHDKTATDV